MAALRVPEMHWTDLILLSLAARSFELIDAFVAGVDRWNISVGSTLVRLQLDNVLRAHLLATTDDPGALFSHLLSDEPLHRMVLPEALHNRLPPEARSGSRSYARDATLKELASQEHPWIKVTYDTASKWVHHSSAHVLTTIRFSDGDGEDEPITFSGRIPVDVDQFDEEFMSGLIRTMVLASDTLLAYLAEWVGKKPEPTQGT